MIGLLCFALAVLASPFKSKLQLEAENVVLRHQLIVLRRRLDGRVRLTNIDRWLFILLYRWFPSILQVLTIMRPETLVRCHRAGFRGYWRWKSRRQGGRPQIETRLRALIWRRSRMLRACNRREAAAGPMLWADYAPEGGVADRLLSQVFQSMSAVRVVSRLCTGQDDAVVASLGDDLERTAARIEIVDHRKNAQFVSSRLCNQRFYPLAHCLL